MTTTNPPKPTTAILELPERFYDRVQAAPFPAHILRFRNQRAAPSIGLDTLSDEAWIRHFGEFIPLPKNLPEPLALRYHGHQFRSYNPDLGDGRGFLFAQFYEKNTGRLMDLGTKGTGKTPWSRGGDGKLTLKGAVRELLATEMLEARGVNTSKTFSIIETGEKLQRHDEPSPTRAAALVRLSHSHIRFGSFQRLAYHKDNEGILLLAHYCARHFYPELADLENGPLVEGLLQRVTEAKAKTVAGWMAAGFVHGVLNTDNMNITGESFDYGPWRFISHVDREFTAAYFDHGKLYAYGRQASSVLWNLARLAECFLPWSSVDRLQMILEDFQLLMIRAWQLHLLQLLGLQPHSPEQDSHTLQATMEFLETKKVPYDQFLFDWYGGIASEERAKQSPNAAFYTGFAFDSFVDALRKHTRSPHTSLDNAYIQQGQPASLVIDKMEAIWAPIADADDWSALEDAVALIRSSAIHAPPRKETASTNA